MNEDAKRISDQLTDPFPPSEVQVKPGSVSGNRAMCLHYIDARTVQDRLDAVVGIDGWQDDYEFLPDGSVVCKLKVRIGGEWIVKTDVGGQSEQPDGGDRTKAAVSDALKRAAVKFGVGRYLYNLPAQWVDYDPKKKQIVKPPALPSWALPKSAKPQTPKVTIDAAQQEKLLALLKAQGKSVAGLVGWLRLPAGTELKQLTTEHYQAALQKLAIQTTQTPATAPNGASHGAANGTAAEKTLLVTADQAASLTELLKHKGKTAEAMLAWLQVPAGTTLAQLTHKQWQAATQRLMASPDPASSAQPPSDTVSFQNCCKALRGAADLNTLNKYRGLYQAGGPGRSYSPQQMNSLEQVYKECLARLQQPAASN